MSKYDEFKLIQIVIVVFTIWNFLFQCFKSVMLYLIYAMMFNGMPIRRHYHLLIISMPTSETALQNSGDRVYTLDKKCIIIHFFNSKNVVHLNRCILVFHSDGYVVCFTKPYYT